MNAPFRTSPKRGPLSLPTCPEIREQTQAYADATDRAAQVAALKELARVRAIFAQGFDQGFARAVAKFASEGGE